MPKVISSEVKEVILKVRNYFMEEKRNNAPIIPYKMVQRRVAAATDISLHTVSNLVKEGNLAQLSIKNIVTREVILMVRAFFLEEKRINGPLVPFQKLHKRVAGATGVSLHTVSNIVKEASLAQSSPEKTAMDLKNRKPRKDKLIMSSFDQQVLKRKIHDFFARKEIPTIRKLHEILKEEIGFKGSREIMRRHIHMLGYRFKKSDNCNKKVLVESNDLPTSQNPCENKDVIGTYSKKDDIMQWLLTKKIEFSPAMTRRELLEIVKRNNGMKEKKRKKPNKKQNETDKLKETVCAVNAILEGLGHQALTLKPNQSTQEDNQIDSVTTNELNHVKDTEEDGHVDYIVVCVEESSSNGNTVDGNGDNNGNVNETIIKDRDPLNATD